jgi:hypothetical protein
MKRHPFHSSGCQKKVLLNDGTAVGICCLSIIIISTT